MKSECVQQCKRACNREYVAASVTMSRFPAISKTEKIRKLLLTKNVLNANFATEDYIRHNYAAVNLYYQSLSCERIEWTEAMDLYQLVSKFFFKFFKIKNFKKRKFFLLNSKKGIFIIKGTFISINFRSATSADSWDSG